MVIATATILTPSIPIPVNQNGKNWESPRRHSRMGTEGFNHSSRDSDFKARQEACNKLYRRFQRLRHRGTRRPPGAQGPTTTQKAALIITQWAELGAKEPGRPAGAVRLRKRAWEASRRREAPEQPRPPDAQGQPERAQGGAGGFQGTGLDQASARPAEPACGRGRPVPGLEEEMEGRGRLADPLRGRRTP